MTTTTRAAALGALAALMLAIGSPRDADGHAGGDGTFHVPEPPQNLRVSGIAGSDSNAAVVSWDAGHSHPGTPFEQTGYTLTITAKVPEPENARDRDKDPDASWPAACIATIVVPNRHGEGICRYYPNGYCPPGWPSEWTVTRNTCRLGSISIPETGSHTEIVSGLTPGTPYFVRVTARYPHGGTGGVTGSVTIFDTEIPDPETPDPETPDPEAPTCTYEHRMTGVPGATGAGFTGQILISSKDATATVKLRAYQHDNGHAIDVLDKEGSAVGASTSLAPANSTKMFRLEEIRGWHTVIVEHPTKAAMENATVAMRLREPDTGATVIPIPGIEHCTTASTTTE